MNPRIGLGIFAASLLGTFLFWWFQEEPAEEPPPKVLRPVQQLPKVAPRIYAFPGPNVAPKPAPSPEKVQVPLSREIHTQLVTATNQAMGAGWQGCIRPWVEENPVDEDVPSEPLVVFFDMVDGRLSDIRLRSPIELPEDLTECFAEAVWQGAFPEDPNHRGNVSVQRVIAIKK